MDRTKQAICEAFSQLLEEKPISKISVREIAAQAQVNPNTVQRALSELEREELLRSGGTSGRTVTEEEGILTALREDTVMALARECAEKFKVFGVTPGQAAELLRQLDKEEN